MPQLRVHPERAFKGGFGITGSGGALMYTDGLGVQKNRGPTKLRLASSTAHHCHASEALLSVTKRCKSNSFPDFSFDRNRAAKSCS